MMPNSFIFTFHDTFTYVRTVVSAVCVLHNNRHISSTSATQHAVYIWVLCFTMKPEDWCAFVYQHFPLHLFVNQLCFQETKCDSIIGSWTIPQTLSCRLDQYSSSLISSGWISSACYSLSSAFYLQEAPLCVVYYCRSSDMCYHPVYVLLIVRMFSVLIFNCVNNKSVHNLY